MIVSNLLCEILKNQTALYSRYFILISADNIKYCVSFADLRAEAIGLSRLIALAESFG